MDTIPNILIVDDEKIYQKMIEGILLSENYKISTVNNGKEALDFIKEGHDFDVIILDIMMRSDREGVDTLKSIKAITPSTQIIMLTVLADLNLAIELMELGAYYYIVKEKLNINRFRDKVAEAITYRRNFVIPSQVSFKEERTKYNFPTPISLQYEEYLNTSSPGKKIINLFDVFELIVKFIADIIICEYLKRFKIRLHSQIKEDLLNKKKGIGSWIGIIHQSYNLKKNIDITGDSKFDIFLNTEVIYELLRMLAKINKHFRSYPYDKTGQQNIEIIKDSEPLIKVLLNEISYLNNYTLAHIIKLIKQEASKYDYRLIEFLGCNPNPPKLDKQFSHPLPENELILMDKTSNFFLSLHPLLIFRTCDRCSLDQIFFFEYVENKKAVYHSFFCGHTIHDEECLNDLENLFRTE